MDMNDRDRRIFDLALMIPRCCAEPLIPFWVISGSRLPIDQPVEESMSFLSSCSTSSRDIVGGIAEENAIAY